MSIRCLIRLSSGSWWLITIDKLANGWLAELLSTSVSCTTMTCPVRSFSCYQLLSSSCLRHQFFQEPMNTVAVLAELRNILEATWAMTNKQQVFERWDSQFSWSFHDFNRKDMERSVEFRSEGSLWSIGWQWRHRVTASVLNICISPSLAC